MPDTSPTAPGPMNLEPPSSGPDARTAGEPTTGLRLIYVADPMCSWCWGFSPVLEELSTEFGLPVEVVVGGLRPGSAARPLDPAMVGYLADTWKRIGRMTGQAFDPTPLSWTGWVYDTELPARAVVAARALDPHRALPMFTRLQRAFYAEAVDITRTENLVRLASESGLATDAFSSLLRSDPNREATWSEFALARSMGISGFPALLAATPEQAWALTLGYQPAAQIRPVLSRVVEGL